MLSLLPDWVSGRRYLSMSDLCQGIAPEEALAK